MENVTLQSIDNRLSHIENPLPDGYSFKRGGAYGMTSIRMTTPHHGVLVEHFGTKREVYNVIPQIRRDWAQRAWANAICDAQTNNVKSVSGDGWHIRFTPQYVFVQFDDGKVKPVVSRRLPRSTNHWEIARIIIPD